MDKILKRKSNIYYLLSLSYMVISIIAGIMLQNGLVIFLAWNMFLATIVYVLSEILVYLIHKKVHLWIILIVFLVWILVFPNSIYMLTDFIHIQNYQFFEDYPNIYNLDLSVWIVFLEIVIGAVYAAKLGIKSIITLEKVGKKYFKKYYYLALSTLFLISSLGIFIGRFLRLNSWNIFDLITQIDTIFSHGTFLLGFIGIFFIIHWVTYYLFKPNEEDIFDKNIERNLEE